MELLAFAKRHLVGKVFCKPCFYVLKTPNYPVFVGYSLGSTQHRSRKRPAAGLKDRDWNSFDC